MLVYICKVCGCLVTPEGYYDPKYKQQTYACPECEAISHDLPSLFILHGEVEEKDIT